MISLSSVAKREKNKLSTNSVFLILIDIILDAENDSNNGYICYNNEDIVWNGKTYYAFPFELGEVKETTDGSDPSVELRVDNTTRAMQSIVEETNGAGNYPVIIRVVNSENLLDSSPELEEYFTVQKTTVTEQFISFTLGCEYSARTRRPLNRYMKNNCPFKFKGLRCGYNGANTTCDHSLTDCRKNNNSSRFGGFPGIDQKGVYIR